MNWSWGQFGQGCDPYTLVKSDKVDICLSEIAVQAIISEYTKYLKYIKSVSGKEHDVWHIRTTLC